MVQLQAGELSASRSTVRSQQRPGVSAGLNELKPLFGLDADGRSAPYRGVELGQPQRQSVGFPAGRTVVLLWMWQTEEREVVVDQGRQAEVMIGSALRPGPGRYGGGFALTGGAAWLRFAVS